MQTATKVTLIIITIIFIYTLTQYIRTRYYVRLGIDLAQSAQSYEQHPEGATQRILIIGDSTAVGTGASSPLFSTAGRLGQDYPLADITNLGVNGSKVAELIPRLEAIQSQEFDLVLIQIGGNDIVRFTNYAELEDDLKVVLQLANQIGNRVIILHCGNVGTAPLFPVGSRWIFTKRTADVREIYQRIVPEYNATYIDLWRDASNDPFAQDPHKYYAADLFHPSNEGYADWYSFIKAAL